MHAAAWADLAEFSPEETDPCWAAVLLQSLCVLQGGMQADAPGLRGSLRVLNLSSNAVGESYCCQTLSSCLC